MSAPVTDLDLHAWLDGELPPERAGDVERWLETHPEDAERLRLWQEQKDGLHRLFDPVLEEEIPERLVRASRRPALAPWLLRTAAAIALVLAGGAGGWMLKGAQAPHHGQAAALAVDALSAHVVYASEVRHPVEVAASDQAHLVGWLSKRLGQNLKVPDLSAKGFSLVGGRLLPAGDGPAAQFMYENAAGQRLTLYLRRNPEGNETAFRFAAKDGAEAFYWLDGPFGYALVGNLPRDQLMPLAESVYKQLDQPAAFSRTEKPS